MLSPLPSLAYTSGHRSSGTLSCTGWEHLSSHQVVPAQHAGSQATILVRVCGSHGERIARHNHLRDHFYQVAASCNLAPRKEENALLPDTNARPADVLIPHWTEGRDTALDVTVVSPLLTDRLANSVSTPGHTLTCAFNDKCRDYLAACRREGIAFIPLPVETLGG